MINPAPSNGTKYIGAAMTILGAIAAANPDTLGKYGPAIIMIAGGLLTVLRGFQNSANNASSKP
jgi:hypothetical protein